MHGIDQAIHLAGNRIGIDRGDRADGVEVDADVTLLSRRTRNGDPRNGRVGRSCRFFGVLVSVEPESANARARASNTPPMTKRRRRFRWFAGAGSRECLSKYAAASGVIARTQAVRSKQVRTWFSSTSSPILSRVLEENCATLYSSQPLKVRILLKRRVGGY